MAVRLSVFECWSLSHQVASAVPSPLDIQAGPEARFAQMPGELSNTLPNDEVAYHIN
jgi:hypothetical protein